MFGQSNDVLKAVNLVTTISVLQNVTLMNMLSVNSPPGSAGSELPCELQLEYWVPNRSGDKSKSALTKETLKGFFKFIQVKREKSSFRLIAVTREKRGKSRLFFSSE